MAFSFHDLVWARPSPKFNWWPAIICDPHEIEESEVKRRAVKLEASKYVIRYFGVPKNQEYGFATSKQMKNYAEFLEEFKAQKIAKRFALMFPVALEEVERFKDMGKMTSDEVSRDQKVNENENTEFQGNDQMKKKKRKAVVLKDIDKLEVKVESRQDRIAALMSILSTSSSSTSQHAVRSIVDSLSGLEQLELSLQELIDAKVLAAVNPLRKHHSQEISAVAKKLRDDWKQKCQHQLAISIAPPSTSIAQNPVANKVRCIRVQEDEDVGDSKRTSDISRAEERCNDVDIEEVNVVADTKECEDGSKVASTLPSNLLRQRGVMILMEDLRLAIEEAIKIEAACFRRCLSLREYVDSIILNDTRNLKSLFVDGADFPTNKSIEM